MSLVRFGTLIAAAAVATLMLNIAGSARTIGTPTMAGDAAAQPAQTGPSKVRLAAAVQPAATYHEKDRGRTVTLPVGTRFSIALKENPTTGYRWSEPEFDKSCLVLDGDEYVPDAGARIGGGGVRTFGFTVVSPGRTVVRLAYRRSWEATTAQESGFEITVIGRGS